MIRTVQLACALPKAEADALNAESGRIYSNMLVSHYRLYRKQDIWLAPFNGKRVEDAYGGPTSLHAHTRDAAQEGFYKACKTAKACRELGLDVKYPYKRKRWRTTMWKKRGLRLADGVLLLARAKGLEPVTLPLPGHLARLPLSAFLEARLVWERAGRHYEWHLVIEDGTPPEPKPGPGIAAVDLGEIHPAALTDGKETCIIACRALRSHTQYTQKRVSELRVKQDHLKRGSRRWKKLQRRKNRFLAQQHRRACDLEHKVTCAVVKWAKERGVGTLVVGDVRDVADGKRMHAKSQQKIGAWSHGRQRAYLEYKAAAAGIATSLEDEHDTTKTCPGLKEDGTPCGHQYKPKGRVYRCPACGLVAHRDSVGCNNILSRRLYGAVGQIVPPPTTTYRYPFWGKRSPLDTGQVVWVLTAGQSAPKKPTSL